MTKKNIKTDEVSKEEIEAIRKKRYKVIKANELVKK